MIVQPPCAKILIVDDNLANLRVLGQLLNRQNYKVSPVPSGAQALKLLQTMQPDLILLDIQMPEIDGFELCRNIKTDPATQDIPVVFISAADEVEQKIKSFEVGGVDYITKPFEEKEVLVRVDTHLRLHSLQRKLEEKINELEQANARITELSIRDELTQLYNRRHLIEVAPNLLAHAKRYNESLSFMIGDIDHFKCINDRFSHTIGDQVLRQVAGMMLTNTREADIVARYGGEEFVIVFPVTPLAEAVQACEKLRQNIAEYGWREIDSDLQVTISIGLSADTSLDSYEQMIAAADQQLYRAKQGGRNRVCFMDA